MKKKNSKIVIISFIVVIIVIFGFIFISSMGKDNNKVKEQKKEDEITENGFDYVLYEQKSKLYKEYYAKLKEELSKKEINYEEYAKIISQLFVTDFYSLEDKKTATDIGGLDFIHSDIKDNFVLKAKDTLYKNIESDVYGERKQELPKIEKVDIKSSTATSVNKDKLVDENAYQIVVSIEYEKDMGYPKEVTLTLVHDEKKLYIIDIK